MKSHILSLDLGKGSLGVAISRSGMFVTPLENIKFHAGDYEEALKILKDRVAYEKIEHIVIGLPTYPSGDPCEMTPVVMAFIPKLQNLFPNIEIETQDERNSTVEASEIMHQGGKNAKKQKANIDSYAAMVILERYLKKIGQM